MVLAAGKPAGRGVLAGGGPRGPSPKVGDGIRSKTATAGSTNDIGATEHTEMRRSSLMPGTSVTVTDKPVPCSADNDAAHLVAVLRSMEARSGEHCRSRLATSPQSPGSI